MKRRAFLSALGLAAVTPVGALTYNAGNLPAVVPENELSRDALIAELVAFGVLYRATDKTSELYADPGVDEEEPFLSHQAMRNDLYEDA